MNSFSINRFGQMLRWLISMNRVMLLGLTVGATFAVFLIQLMTLEVSSGGDVISYLRDCSGFGEFMIPIFMAVLVSSLFSNYTSIGTKQQRGTFLMIPATNMEKFLALIVHVTVVCGLCAIVGYIVGDSLRMASLWIWSQISADPEFSTCIVVNNNGADKTYCFWSSTVSWLLGPMTPPLNTVCGNGIFSAWFLWARWICISLGSIWTCSFFTLGGTLLRKYSFAITGVFWLAIVLLFMGTLAHFNHSVFGKVTLADGTIVTATVDTLAYVLMVVLPLLSYLNYRASFHIFKGFQLITNKWTNYDILKR